MTLRRALIAFVAGFVATLIAHQGALAILHALGVTPAAPYSMARTWPFGVPQVVSLAFWGGVWGIVLALALPRTLALGRYVGAGAVFGALLPSAVALLVVFPLKGRPIAGGGDPQLIAGALILNGLWGAATALMVALGDRAAAKQSVAARAGALR